jgi:hypothetical protein
MLINPPESFFSDPGSTKTCTSGLEATRTHSAPAAVLKDAMAMAMAGSNLWLTKALAQSQDSFGPMKAIRFKIVRGSASD